MMSLQDISYRIACQKAYKGQIECPYVVYQRANGTWDAMPYSTYKIMKIGMPSLFVFHTSKGMSVGLYSCRENHWKE